jgi:hypothetical protein
MSTKQPRYRYSWKKPWLFDDIHMMRKYITEREAYKKLKLLERHSAFKKPYWNLKGHQFGELLYSPSGYPPGYRPGGGGWVPPSGGGDPTYGGCEMACNGGSLDCEGGMCDDIVCICGIPPYVVEIIEDPTGGRAYGVSGLRPMVCLERSSVSKELKYAVVRAVVTDAVGQVYETEHQLINCSGCCDVFTLSGSSTQNPGTTWEGTLDIPCPGATCEVSSNSGCAFGCSMSPDGSTVSVVVGANDCGSFTVTVTYNQQDCEGISASIVVRINNTGQGGTWNLLYICNETGGWFCGDDDHEVYEDQYKWVGGVGCQGDDWECGDNACDDVGYDESKCIPCVLGHRCVIHSDKYEWKCTC